MDILKTLRKSYFTMFLASLVLLISCSQYDDEIIDTNEKLSLSNYIEEHLKLTTELMILLESERNIDKESFLKSMSKKSKSISENSKPEEIIGTLVNANFQQSNVISELFLKIYYNNLNFINSNPDLKNLNKNEIENMITVEIDKKLIQFLSNKSSDSCKETWVKALSRCKRNAAISMGASLAVGAFTGGTGYLVGFFVSGVVAGICASDADADYSECMGW
ncbi:biotin transporter BioY [Psychroflexus sp. YR1-1]|uniref:Biotin transporter BioY n=1 Tax=Psychroflexus aurantiacus TaxID=2709310 RepID=A0A6B3QXR5_9FLAO|nr:biotin transporter BioY [Psychroflexus aurantiacus]NEV92993.1 biotin transporter BioY [Psychroflexus aurantiacus]